MVFNQKFNRTTIPLSFVLLATFHACGERPSTLEKKEMSTLNIPTYTFELPLDNLRDTVISIFDFEEQYENKYLGTIFYYIFPENSVSTDKHLITFSVETSKDAVFGANHFQKPNTDSDIYLNPLGDLWHSPVYYAKGKPLHYSTSFIIKFIKIDEFRTQLIIEAEDPYVVNGTAGYGPHGPDANLQKVAPTTIEEYVLLQYVVDKLGEKSLPPIKKPND